MEFSVREMTEADLGLWAQMRASLWPSETAEWHAADVAGKLSDPEFWGFLAQAPAGEGAGFAELSIRKYANGCDSSPVPFLEGIWTAPKFRRQGVAARLAGHIEAFVLARGFTEIGSDALIENTISHAAHARWGFQETERVVCFRKLLRAPAPAGGYRRA
jgi:aminoglycoside 6'-N-acetyltransferase I